MNIRRISILPLIIVAIAFLGSCKTNELSPGLEYMPDMYRSPSIEEYVDYGEIQERRNDSIATKLSAMVPPMGTIPYAEDASDVEYNFPYPYPEGDEGYAAASASLKNPLAFNEAVYNEGKEIFGKFCVHCHDEKGTGKGSITLNGAFPPPPSYAIIKDLNQGKMFHTLMRGKGNMGSHSSQLTQKELWTVVHYVQTLRDEKYDYASVIAPVAPASSDENENE
ncbi:MAG: mono/diheme cytochrome c family protein [Patiriisocius sp.]|jgi:mono/diheme cytochrome c family protein